MFGMGDTEGLLPLLLLFVFFGPIIAFLVIAIRGPKPCPEPSRLEPSQSEADSRGEAEPSSLASESGEEKPGAFEKSSPGGEFDSDRFRPHRGGIILALGILSLVTCPLIGFIPWVMGNADLEAMRRGSMDPSGKGTTQAGQILGMVTTVMSLLGCVCVLALPLLRQLR